MQDKVEFKKVNNIDWDVCGESSSKEEPKTH
jgi:hypothetical protein